MQTSKSQVVTWQLDRVTRGDVTAERPSVTTVFGPVGPVGSGFWRSERGSEDLHGLRYAKHGSELVKVLEGVGSFGNNAFPTMNKKKGVGSFGEGSQKRQVLSFLGSELKMDCIGAWTGRLHDTASVYGSGFMPRLAVRVAIDLGDQLSACALSSWYMGDPRLAKKLAMAAPCWRDT